MMAARELLRHPPGAAASPSAMAQWQEDVDRLLHLAQGAPSSSRAGAQPSANRAGRPRRRQQGGASVSVHSPSVRGAPTEDLRAELDRRHAGDDARVAIEKARERRHNIEGRNLEADFAAVAQKSPGGARATPGAVLSGVGCAALTEHLRTAKWPPKFWPHLPEKYDRTSNPSEFLQVYVTAITAAGGDGAVMASYFHVALSGLAQT